MFITCMAAPERVPIHGSHSHDRFVRLSLSCQIATLAPTHPLMKIQE
ncbi:hypothetical protein ATPR_2246 [Acetobacter tropicalis NBRC 101654]|uniref:Uncharacterized protein n=1 Tax=Acetobacter tropicalis NBRC 101654 TaxID=749388 RepID=F7VFU7_9PROT|nr:hypothetical protein ATPR_2246 [Acetobacter tropicalis NBRC 101654]